MTLTLQTLLDQVFTVEDLMTPRKQLFEVEPGDLQNARIEAEQQGFDLVPIIENDCIIGVWHQQAINFEPLTDRWLVSRDTSIPDLLTLFVESQRPGFLVLHRQEIIGLVTPADLNKLPMRVYIYNLIGELELGLAALMQDHFQINRMEAIRQKLGEDRWQKITESEERLRKGNVDVDPIQLLYLNDLVNIVCKTEDLLTKLKMSGTEAKKLGGLVRLRDRTMHPVRPLLEQYPDDLWKLHERLQRIENVLRAVNLSLAA